MSRTTEVLHAAHQLPPHSDVDKYLENVCQVADDQWPRRRLGELLTYERPDRYIVKSTEYLERGDTPVLTANKSFILGYTAEDFDIFNDVPAIIFDDFTTDCKYVTFPFKVKSSAIKILRAKHNEMDLRYVFELMRTIQFPASDHKRYYISEYQGIEIPLPPYDEQQSIAEVLSDVDETSDALDSLITKKRLVKQAVMQQLLTGKVRLDGFGERWEMTRLGHVAHIKTGSKNNQDKVDDGEYPFFVRSPHVERIDSYSFEGEAILVPGEGNIGSIFHYVNGRYDVHQRVYNVSRFAKNVCGKFLYYSMAMNYGSHAMQNTVKATVDSLRLPTFKNFRFPLPTDIAEQRAIAAALTDIDAEIDALEARRDKILAIKQGMMQQLLTGRIRLVDV